METGDKYLGVMKSHTWKSLIKYAKDVELFGKGSTHKFYRLKTLITLEQVNTSVVLKKEESSMSKTSRVRLCKLSLRK